MRQRALHAAAGATEPDGQRAPGAPSMHRTEHHTSPSDAGLPPAPTPDRGLVPTGTATTAVADGPLAAVESQRFGTVPLRHEASLAVEETGTTLTATLTNTDEQAWAYRVPRGPAPFAGGSKEHDDGELRVRPLGDDTLFSDGVLAPGESVRAELSVSVLGGIGTSVPDGEYAFQQPLTVWTAEETYGYNWQLTLVV